MKFLARDVRYIVTTRQYSGSGGSVILNYVYEDEDLDPIRKKYSDPSRFKDIFYHFYFLMIYHTTGRVPF